MSKKTAAPEVMAPEVLQTKVLLAEDDESFIDALVIGLGREGFDVSVARDGNEALRLFAAVEPDLVLLDLMLPRLSGIDVCRSIRARSTVPIIMVTAKGTEIDTVVGLEVGADDYVSKPYRLRELVARMRAVLRRTPSTGGGPGASPARDSVGREMPRQGIAWPWAAWPARCAMAMSASRPTRCWTPVVSRSILTAIWCSSAARMSTCVARSSNCFRC